MKAVGALFLKIGLVTVLVMLAEVLFLGSQGQLTSLNLSDGLVYACFALVSSGTLLGVFNVGYRRRPTQPGEPPEGPFEHALKDFLHPSALGWTILAAGILCFAMAIVVDLVF